MQATGKFICTSIIYNLYNFYNPTARINLYRTFIGLLQDPELPFESSKTDLPSV